MTTTRRTSARLSGGSVEEVAPPTIASSSRTTKTNSSAAASTSADGAQRTARKRRSAEGGDGEGAVASGSIAAEASAPAGKKRKVANEMFATKPAQVRKGKSAFNPTPLAAAPAQPPDAIAEPSTIPQSQPYGFAPLPPPPSERNIARRRASARGALGDVDMMDSPPLVPIDQAPKKTAHRKGKSVEKTAMNGKKAGVVDEVVDGLDEDGLSLEAELGRERDKEARQISNVSTRPAASTPAPSLSLLSFKSTEQAEILAPRPVSPPPKAFDYRFQTPRRPDVSRRRSLAPATAAALRVGDALNHDDGMIVPIPISDTPMIKRNQEMRRENERRRSSMTLRGNRMSESLGKGDISTPHTSVPTNTFWKHLTPSLPEPVKARHLLIWLTKRALDGELNEPQPSKGKDKQKPTYEPTLKGEQVVKDVLNELLGMTAKGQVDTNVFPLPGAKPAGGELRPHPRNVANKKAYALFETFLAKCRSEAPKWQSLVDTENARLSEFLKKDRPRILGLTPEERSQPVLLGEGERLDRLKQWNQLADEVLTSAEELVKIPEGEVEFQVDTLHQASHSAVQYSTQASRFMDGIFASLAQDLRTRDGVGVPSSSTSSSIAAPTSRDPINLLRALAATEADRQTEETVVAASSLPPAAMATPRRAAAASGGMATPRRQGLGATMTPSRRGREADR